MTERSDDPFYDQGDAEEIGKAHLWLLGLCHFIDTEDTVPIISKSGQSEGRLVVRTLIAEPNGRNNPAYYRNFSSVERMVGSRLDLLVEIVGCQQMDQSKYGEVFARFRFFNDEDYSETKPASKPVGAPVFRFRKHVTIPSVTNEFINYLQKDALTIEVWGTLTSRDARSTSVASTTAKGATAKTPAQFQSLQSRSSFKDRAQSSTQQRHSMSGIIPPATTTTTSTTNIALFLPGKGGSTSSMTLDNKRKSLTLGPELLRDVESRVIERENTISTLEQQLRQVEDERRQLQERMAVMQQEAERVQALMARVSDLEAENERLRGLMVSAKQPSTTRNRPTSASFSAGMGAGATITAASGKAGAPMGRMQRSLSPTRGPSFNAASSPRRASPPKKTTASAPANGTAKDRMEAMKKRFGN